MGFGSLGFASFGVWEFRVGEFGVWKFRVSGLGFGDPGVSPALFG